jgi:signal transduction histidine kinase
MAAISSAVAPASHVSSPPLRLLAMAGLSTFCTTMAGAMAGWLPGALLPVWLGTAVVVYWLLRTPRRYWPFIIATCWLAYVAAAFTLGRGMPRGILLPTVNLIQAILVALPLRLLRLDRNFARPRTLIVFYALVLGPASMAPALVAAFVLDRLAGVPMFQGWTEWYVTSSLGVAMLVPPLIVLRRNSLGAIFTPDRLPGTIALLGIMAAVIAVNFLCREYPLGFLFFPAVVLITFQRGFAGGFIGLILVVLYLAVGVNDIHRTLPAADAHLHLIFVQLYTAAISFTVVIVGTGLEQRRKLEQSLAEAREEAFVARDAAEAASRAKTMFLANMSHELRTPLNAVIGFSNLMHREMYGPLGDRRYREYASSIQDAGRHLLDIIGDILDMSKIEAGKYEISREILPLNALVGECLELMRDRAAEQEVYLVSELRGPERILADRRAMKQILINLLSNAIKFTPAGGKISVITKTQGDSLVLAVADTGVGIPADELHQLGKPFVQLRRTSAAITTQPGTGLGLALVRALAEKHGGALVIDSEEGLGTCARIEIPLAGQARVKTAA